MDFFWIIIIDKQVVATSVKRVTSLKSELSISQESAEYMQKISRKFIDKSTFPNEVITEVDDPFVFKCIVDKYEETQRVYAIGSYVHNFSNDTQLNTLEGYLHTIRKKTENYRIYNDITTELQKKKFIEIINDNF